MPPLRPSVRHLLRPLRSRVRSSAASISSRPPPFPVVPTCPDPTCPCSAMPEGLEIDRKNVLNGTMSPHAQHLVVSSGRSDWTSKIEDEKETAAWGRFTADIKGLLGRGGEFHDPYHNDVMVSTSSFTPSELADQESSLGTIPLSSAPDQEIVDAILFPAFRHFRGLTLDPKADISRKLVKSWLLPEERKLNPGYKDLTESERRAKSRDPALGDSLLSQSVEAPTILICSHGQRDSRCGILGPLLHAEFTSYINERKPIDREIELEARPGAFLASSSSTSEETINVNIGMISHIGGHKWAGNVIMYIPPTFQHLLSASRSPHPLAGMGIWYGRVEPRHVEGIIEQTLLQGKVIQDLFRGGLGQGGETLRL
ncbi:Sucraseferredoxin-like protein [Exophiala viscosa]|uniref:Altered inheritance of mitochondria protein 32 n=1 Tax=Exophiala viscosa TaxID=2486360 RepID=A0AAN6E218_9EURO|nr:Sucraseferredoxin-like protein [Exophiala viscosa]